MPRPELVRWMTLVARHVRSSADPGPTQSASRAVARTVVFGDADVFLPAPGWLPAVRRALDTELEVIASGEHLVDGESPRLIAELALTGAGGAD